MILNEKQKEFIQNSINHLDAGKLGAFRGGGCVYKNDDRYCIVGCNIPKEDIENISLNHNDTPVLKLPNNVLKKLPFKPSYLKIFQILHDTWVVFPEMNFGKVLRLILSGDITIQYVASNYGIRYNDKYWSLTSRDNVYKFYQLNNFLGGM